MDLPNTRLWRDDSRPKAGSPLIVILLPSPTAFDGAAVLSGTVQRQAPRLVAEEATNRDSSGARDGFWVMETKRKQAFRSNKKLTKEKRCAALLKRLTKKAPYKEFQS